MRSALRGLMHRLALLPAVQPEASALHTRARRSANCNAASRAPLGPSLSKEALRAAVAALGLFDGDTVTREALLVSLSAEHPLRQRKSVPLWSVLAVALLDEQAAAAAPRKRARTKAPSTEAPPAKPAAKPAASVATLSLSGPLTKPAARARAAVEPPALPPPPPRELRSYQRAGVDFILSRSPRAALLADDMGRGKTAQALAALAEAELVPAVVVCPAFLKLNWEREAASWLPGRRVHIVQASSREPWPVDAALIVINYDIVSRHVDELTALRPAALVLDESQYIKSEEAKRSQAALKLAADARARGALVLLLSGTPVLNRPLELVTQMVALGVRVANLSPLAFKNRYCDPREVRVPGRAFSITSFAGASHVPELAARLAAAPWFLRRLKREVLAELPAKLHCEVVLALPEEAIRTYRAHVQKAAAEEKAARAKEDNPFATPENRALGAMAKLRALLAQVKLPSVLQWVEGWLEANPPDTKLIVFASHVSMVDGVAARFGGLRIRGSDAAAARQAAVDAFQAPGGPRVIACNIQAAGVGLTLTAASGVAFAERDWAPASNVQAEDRAHRLGQERQVTVFNLVAGGTFDSVVEAVLARKRTVVVGAMDGGRDEEAGVAEAVARHLGF